MAKTRDRKRPIDKHAKESWKRRNASRAGKQDEFFARQRMEREAAIEAAEQAVQATESSRVQR